MEDQADTASQVFGYTVCSTCGDAVLTEIAWKTSGRCAPCFRAHFNEVLDEIVVITPDRQELRVKVRPSKRHPSELAGRRRAKKRAKKRPDVRDRARIAATAQARAKTRLARLFPEIYEVMLADERAKLGLEAWTIERAITPHKVDESTYALLRSYHLS